MTRRRCDCCGDVFFADYMVGWTCLSCRVQSRETQDDRDLAVVPEST